MARLKGVSLQGDRVPPRPVKLHLCCLLTEHELKLGLEDFVCNKMMVFVVVQSLCTDGAVRGPRQLPFICDTSQMVWATLFRTTFIQLLCLKLGAIY